jgi:hypothetical protein
VDKPTHLRLVASNDTATTPWAIENARSQCSCGMGKEATIHRATCRFWASLPTARHPVNINEARKREGYPAIA